MSAQDGGSGRGAGTAASGDEGSVQAVGTVHDAGGDAPQPGLRATAGTLARSAVPRRHEWAVLVWMVLVYTALLGTASLASVVAAVVVVAVLRVVFPLSPSPEPYRVRPVAMAVLVAVVLGEMVRASAQVAWLALRPGPPPVTAVVAVPLRSRSQVVAVTTSMIITLLPGSLLVDLDVPTATLYVHALGAGDPVPDAVHQAQRVEALVARALGRELSDEPVATTTASSGRGGAS